MNVNRISELDQTKEFLPARSFLLLRRCRRRHHHHHHRLRLGLAWLGFICCVLLLSAHSVAMMVYYAFISVLLAAIHQFFYRVSFNTFFFRILNAPNNTAASVITVYYTYHAP